jgi:hypothetical protein
MKRTILLSLVIFASACKGNEGSKATTAHVDAAPSPQLPAPYSDVRIGMSEAQLLTLFPAEENLKACGDAFAGRESPRPPQVPGADTGTRASCLRSADISGFAINELASIVATDTPGSPSDEQLADYVDGVLLAGAQLRGTIRAGELADTDVFSAVRGSLTTYGAVAPAAAALANGSFSFTKDSAGRRAMCATISDDCSDFDPVRLSKYESGGYSTGALDEEAHSRVVDGKCRNSYLGKEKSLRYRFVKRTGGIAGVGLARGSRTDHAVDPNTASTFQLFTDRSHVSAGIAKVGATIANASAKVREYWQGAFVIRAGKVPEGTPWGTAVVWIRDGSVARVLVNILQDKTLGDLPKELAAVYGSPSSSSGTSTAWRRSDAEVTLDIGGRADLTVERPAPPANAR